MYDFRVCRRVAEELLLYLARLLEDLELDAITTGLNPGHVSTRRQHAFASMLPLVEQSTCTDDNEIFSKALRRTSGGPGNDTRNRRTGAWCALLLVQRSTLQIKFDTYELKAP